MMRSLTLLLLLFAAPSWALPNDSCVFEVRTTGAGTNGGGFVTGSSGTDYSQNDNKNATSCTNCGSATDNISTTDAVTANSATLTSATANFTAAIVGNIIYLQGGSGALAAHWYQVTAFTNSTTVTVDHIVGTASTGVTMNIGGALSKLADVETLVTANAAPGYTAWIKSGTYSSTTTTSLSDGDSAQTYNGSHLNLIQGYGTTRGDTGTRPLLTSATDSVNILSLSGSSITLKHLSISSTASTRGVGVYFSPSYVYISQIDDCVFDGLNPGVYDHHEGHVVQVMNSELKNGTDGLQIGGGQMTVYNSYIHNNSNDGIKFVAGAVTNIPEGWATVSGTIIYSNGGKGIEDATSNGPRVIQLINCAIVSNTSDGIAGTNGTTTYNLYAANTIFYGNGGWAMNYPVNSNWGLLYQRNNAFGSNTGGVRNHVGALSSGTGAVGDITLTATPFTSAGTDFSLNNTAGGGALLRGAGFPGALIAGGTGYLDVGPLQHQSVSSQRAYGSVQ